MTKLHYTHKPADYSQVWRYSLHSYLAAVHPPASACVPRPAPAPAPAAAAPAPCQHQAARGTTELRAVSAPAPPGRARAIPRMPFVCVARCRCYLSSATTTSTSGWRRGGAMLHHGVGTCSSEHSLHAWVAVGVRKECAPLVLNGDADVVKMPECGDLNNP